MSVSQIRPSETRALAEVSNLLAKTGLSLDEHLDYTCAIRDEDGRVIATGSAFGPTLRCFAVDPAHQGEGLLNEIVSHLTEERMARNYVHLFVYTKPASARFFRDLGFYAIAEVPGKLVFLENRRHGFGNYLRRLETQRRPGSAAAIVMNANPFTLGHRHLIEQAARENDTVHLFLLSEEAGPIPAAVRRRLVRDGVADLANVLLHETEDYLISSATFPGYFLRTEERVLDAQARLDTALFTQIAGALGITARYVGEEPTSVVTGLYNRVLGEVLPAHGIACRVVPRRTLADGRVISASAVRQAIHDGRLDDVAPMLPATTLVYFRSVEASPVVAALQAAQDVVHY